MAETIQQVMSYFRIKVPELARRSRIKRSTLQLKTVTGKLWAWEAETLAEALGVPEEILHFRADVALAWLHENRPDRRSDLPGGASYRCTRPETMQAA